MVIKKLVDFKSTFSFMWIHTNWLRKPYVRKSPVTCGRTVVLLSFNYSEVKIRLKKTLNNLKFVEMTLNLKAKI